MTAQAGVVTPTWARPTPRASERGLSALGALCFRAFLACQFLSLTRLFFIQHVGGAVESVASQAGMLSVFLLVPAVLGYGVETRSLFGALVPGARAWVAVVSTLCVFLFFYGWKVKGNYVTTSAHDLAPYVVIVCSVVLGSMRQVWARTDRTILVLFLLALVVNAIAMTEITTVISEDHADDRAGISTLAYRTQGALAFWPLLLLTAPLRSRKSALLIFSGVFFVLAQQILFQKRSPTFRVSLFILVFLLVLPRLAARARPRGQGGGSRGVRGAFAGIGIAAVVLALTTAPWLFEGQAQGLLRRISGEAYSGGALGMLTSQNERFFEAGMFLRTLDPADYVLGRGFGGYFVPDTPGWGVWLEDVSEWGRRQLHVGGLMPFFKGGVALALIYYAGTLSALWRGRRLLDQPFAAAAFFVVLLHHLFLLQDGWFIMSASCDLVMVGLCIGYLLSSERPEPPSRLDLLRASVRRSLR